MQKVFLAKFRGLYNKKTNKALTLFIISSCLLLALVAFGWVIGLSDFGDLLNNNSLI